MNPNESAILILAHTDDEIMALHLLHILSKPIIFVYLTDGKPQGAEYSPALRVEENAEALKALNLKYEAVQFGCKNSIRDGCLALDFKRQNFKDLVEIINSYNPKLIVTTAFEGGHQDHDAAFLISHKLSRQLNLPIWVFPTYRSMSPKFKLYRVMQPINDLVSKKIELSPRSRFQIIKIAIYMIVTYKSQARTWLGLTIPMLRRYTFTSQYVYKYQEEIEIPHYTSTPFYEVRNRATRSELALLFNTLSSIH
jgi:LmbE family N-acetylglucosaminyl deacetylase